MGEGFKRLKRLYLREAIIKASLVYISVALLVVATFLIVIDKGKIDFNIFGVFSIGIGLGLLLGTAVFFLFYRGDKHFAKILDKELELNEKVQTMHAFRKEDGCVTELQRAETQIILNCSRFKKSKRITSFVIFGLITAVAITYFAISLFLYLKRDEPNNNIQNDAPNTDISRPDEGNTDQPSVDDKFEPTEHHKKELEQLIEYVSSSALQDNAKASVILELTSLLNSLDTFSTESALKARVVEVIKSVRATVDSVNTTNAFVGAIDDSNHKNFNQLCKAIYAKDLSKVESTLATLYNDLLYSKVEQDGEIVEVVKPKEELENIKGELEIIKNILNMVLEQSTLTENDKLHTLITELCQVLTEIIDKSKSINNVFTKLTPVLNGTFIDGLRQLVPAEKTNEDVKVYTVNELKRIFEVTSADLGELPNSGETTPDGPEGPEEGPPESENGGSYGDGGNNFRSEDLVIDPESSQVDIEKIQVEYGEILSRYETEIMNNLDKYPEEIQKMLKEYFDMLKTPIDK
ncbi:MAG: hypothetical protein J6B45_03835 [Clostridia bacterium]|nr:hypothetical protein [Clostridia bacterium]